ncbi:MAG: long-chain fatty acid--CoA ligase, partial [bacterium]|nr:long-chain fatty acid--CoA ligase [bacterium]
MNIVCPISFNAAQSPRDTAIIPGSGSLTYLQLHDYVSTVTSTLQNMGVKNGSRFALTGHNSLEFVAVLLALWRLKATAIPLNFRFPNHYINKILKKTNASFLVSNPNIDSNPT